MYRCRSVQRYLGAEFTKKSVYEALEGKVDKDSGELPICEAVIYMREQVRNGCVLLAMCMSSRLSLLLLAAQPQRGLHHFWAGLDHARARWPGSCAHAPPPGSLYRRVTCRTL